MLLCVGMFSMLKCMRWIAFEQPDFTVNTVLHDMFYDYPEPFTAREHRFEFAVTFLSILPYKFVKPDPRIGQINMRRVDMNSTGTEIIFTKFPANVAPCDPEVDFIGDTTDDVF